MTGSLQGRVLVSRLTSSIAHLQLPLQQAPDFWHLAICLATCRTRHRPNLVVLSESSLSIFWLHTSFMGYSAGMVCGGIDGSTLVACRVGSVCWRTDTRV